MRTYLTSGGAGFIGSNFIHYILKKYEDIQIVNVDKLTYAGNLMNLQEWEKHPRYTFVQADICDEDAMRSLFHQYEINGILNFAAESHVDRSIVSSKEFIQTNVQGTATLLSEARQAWEMSDGQYKDNVKFLQVSTDEVYGSLGEIGSFSEATPLNPRNPYAASKGAADLLVQAYAQTYGIPVNITRCSNNYGSYQFPEKLIPLIIYNALRHEQLPVYGDGKQIRDWIYVEDHCSAIDTVFHHGKAGEVYNIGGNNEQYNIHLVERIVEYIQKHYDPKVGKHLIRHVEDRKGHDRRYSIDATKIRTELGWEPGTSFEEGIKKTISWYMDHEQWLKSVTSGIYQEYYASMYGKGSE